MRAFSKAAINDTALNQHIDFGYDEFNRLTSSNISQGQQTFSYVYDRYGNRTQQNAPQGGPAPSYSVNPSNNQITSFSYDAAGNLTSDGFHTYIYDAEGNIIGLDGYSNGTYVYNALNQRVQVDLPTVSRQYLYNASGQRVSVWDSNTQALVHGQYYWGNSPVAYYDSSSLHFQHQDWMGTERLQTSYNGGVEGTYSSLPWGDAYSASGSDNDRYHFAQLDRDSETDTHHAQFRQYSSTQGRWMSPDPYDGSYRMGNPQSFNRYAYVMNNPVIYLDRSGLCGETTTVSSADTDDVSQTWDDCVDFIGGGGDGGSGGGGGGGGGTSTAPSNPTQKSPARQQCEQQAAQHLQSTMSALDASFIPSAIHDAKVGAVTGAVVGCVTGAVLASPTGPGAIASCAAGVPIGFLGGGATGAIGSMGNTIYNGIVANYQYYQQVTNVCSKL
jgi:RHS repeat-associated protein